MHQATASWQGQRQVSEGRWRCRSHTCRKKNGTNEFICVNSGMDRIKHLSLIHTHRFGAIHWQIIVPCRPVSLPVFQSEREPRPLVGCHQVRRQSFKLSCLIRKIVRCDPIAPVIIVTRPNAIGPCNESCKSRHFVRKETPYLRS